MMETDRIYLRNFLDNGLPDHCADLIVADPPYYRVKGDFDKVWPDFSAYLADVRLWAAECCRILSYSGTLVWFGSWRNIAYIQEILDADFHLVNSCVVEKKNSMQNKIAKAEAQRSFFTNDERFLVYESMCGDLDISTAGKALNRYRTATGLARSSCFMPIIEYLNGERERAGFTVKMINSALGTNMATHWFTMKSQWELPMSAWYEKLRRLFNASGNGEYLKKEYEELKKEYEELKKEYEELKKEYEELRRPFRMEGRQSDIFRITVDGGIGSRLGHPTVKDLNLMRTLVSSLSREGDLVVEPFAGTGTACLAAGQLGRRYIGYEIDGTYHRIAEGRLSNIQRLIV